MGYSLVVAQYSSGSRPGRFPRSVVGRIERKRERERERERERQRQTEKLHDGDLRRPLLFLVVADLIGER